MAAPPKRTGRGSGRVTRIPYTVVRDGHRYFQPRGRMLQHGFRPLPLGPDDEAARRKGMDLYEKWVKIRDGGIEVEMPAGPKTKDVVCAARSYPHGSVGEAWQRWIRTEEWAKMAPTTRNKIWWEAWTKRIEPAFADQRPDFIAMQDISLWRKKIEGASGMDAAHKALKVWRAFWRVMKAMRYTQLSDPSEKVVNKAPPTRTEKWKHGEAMRLTKRAWRMGFRGLACIVVTAWDAGFAPVDCRSIRAKHLMEDRKNGRLVFDLSQEGRGKTGVPVIGTLSPFGDWLVRRYLIEFGAKLTPDAFLFRMRKGGPYGESRLGNDFAKVREAEMPGEDRQLRDMRRSGVMEAFAGDAKPENIAEKFGNSINHSNVLFRTYNPVDLEKVRLADKQRLVGRRRRNAS